MTEMTTNTDRLVELILKEDKNDLSELLTTDRAIQPQSRSHHGYIGEKRKKFSQFRFRLIKLNE